MNQLKNLLSLFTILTLASCASNYYPIKPLTLDFKNPPDTLAGGKIEISYLYDVLREAGNRRYGKKEKRTGVSLLALRIVNDSQDTLRFPEEVLILSNTDTIWPLYLEEAGEALRQTRSEDGGVVEVETGFLVSLLEGIATAAVEAKANQQFGEELDEYYLVFSDILPGTAVVGLVALEVNRGTPLRFLVKY